MLSYWMLSQKNEELEKTVYHDQISYLPVQMARTYKIRHEGLARRIKLTKYFFSIDSLFEEKKEEEKSWKRVLPGNKEEKSVP